MDIFIKSESEAQLVSDLLNAGLLASDQVDREILEMKIADPEVTRSYFPSDWTRFDGKERSDFHYCGQLCASPGVYDDAGNEVVAPVMYDGVHLNVRCGSTVAQIIADAGFETVTPETPNVVFG